MVIVINCGEIKQFLENFIDKDSKIFDLIIKIVNKTESFDINKRVEKIFHNLFLDEYKVLFFNNKLDDNYNYFNEKYMKQISTPVEVFEDDVYTNLLEFLMNFN